MKYPESKCPDYDFPAVGDKFTQTAYKGGTMSSYGSVSYFDNLVVTGVRFSAGHVFIRYTCVESEVESRRFGSELRGYETEKEWIVRSKIFRRKKKED